MPVLPPAGPPSNPFAVIMTIKILAVGAIFVGIPLVGYFLHSFVVKALAYREMLNREKFEAVDIEAQVAKTCPIPIMPMMPAPSFQSVREKEAKKVYRLGGSPPPTVYKRSFPEFPDGFPNISPSADLVQPVRQIIPAKDYKKPLFLLPVPRSTNGTDHVPFSHLVPSNNLIYPSLRVTTIEDPDVETAAVTVAAGDIVGALRKSAIMVLKEKPENGVQAKFPWMTALERVDAAAEAAEKAAPAVPVGKARMADRPVRRSLGYLLNGVPVEPTTTSMKKTQKKTHVRGRGKENVIPVRA